jgi:hypothetical protein
MRGYVTREALYEEVWSVPLWTLCEKYGLSDNGLRKVCKRLNVPVPSRGYWAKFEAGHRVPRPKLPKDAKQTYFQVRPPMPARTVADDTDEAWLAERKAYEADPARAVVVALKPRRWHAAVAPLNQFFKEEAKAVEASRRAEEAYQKWPEWRKQRDMGPDRSKWMWVERAGQLMPATNKAFVARLSLGTYQRGLAILNGLAITATNRGFDVTYSEEKGRILLKGHGGDLELRMSEATEARTRKVKRYDGQMEDERYKVPTGRIRLVFARRYNLERVIEEAAGALLETQLNNVMKVVWELVVKCRGRARWDAQAREREAALAAERAEAERIRREEAQRLEEERQRRTALIDETAAWRRAADIRAYVAAVRSSAESRGSEALASVELWVAWALRIADEGDPLVGRAGS